MPRCQARIDDRRPPPSCSATSACAGRVDVALASRKRAPAPVRTLRRLERQRASRCSVARSAPAHLQADAADSSAPRCRCAVARLEELPRARDRGAAARLLARVVIELHGAQAERRHRDAAVRRRRTLMEAVPVAVAVLTRDQQPRIDRGAEVRLHARRMRRHHADRRRPSPAR